MEKGTLPVVENIESEEMGLRTADLDTIMEVPAIESFITDDNNVLHSIPTDLLDTLNQMELHLECDDDGNYDVPDKIEETNIYPTALVGNNVSLRISFSNNMTVKQEKRGKKELKCLICQEKFKMETKFYRHMLHFHNIRHPFQCPNCSYRALSQRLLSKHVTRHHIQKDVFSEHFTNEKDKSEHPNTDGYEMENSKNKDQIETQKVNNGMVADTNIKQSIKSCVLKCDECGNTYKQKKSLILHMKRHANEFHFHCESCGKKFLSSVSLKRHLKTHKEIRQFACRFPNCNKSFKLLGALTDHERYTHRNCKNNIKSEFNRHKSNKDEDVSNSRQRNEKKFTCPFDGCKKTFRDSYNLRTHYAIHSGVKDRKCAHCSFTCVQKSSLNLHLKSKHGEILASNTPLA